MRRIKNTLVYNVFLICLTGLAAQPILGQDTSKDGVQQTEQKQKTTRTRRLLDLVRARWRRRTNFLQRWSNISADRQ